MAKKRPGRPTGPKSGPKKKKSRKTVRDSSSDPVAEQEIILELDSRAYRPDFICVTDTESEEEPEVKPSKVPGNPHLGAIWEVNGHGIPNDELPPMDLIAPPQMSPTKKNSPANQVWIYEHVHLPT